jgi:hypothetical protein
VASKRKSVRSLSRIVFGKRGDKARQNIIGEELCGMNVALNFPSSIANVNQMIFYNDWLQALKSTRDVI